VNTSGINTLSNEDFDSPVASCSPSTVLSYSQSSVLSSHAMRFTNLLTAAAVMTAATSGVEASVIVDKGLNLKLGASLSLNNHYGAPHAPWESGHKPGWYYGHNGGLLGEIPSLTSGVRPPLFIFPEDI